MIERGKEEPAAGGLEFDLWLLSRSTCPPSGFPTLVWRVADSTRDRQPYFRAALSPESAEKRIGAAVRKYKKGQKAMWIARDRDLAIINNFVSAHYSTILKRTV